MIGQELDHRNLNLEKKKTKKNEGHKPLTFINLDPYRVNTSISILIKCDMFPLSLIFTYVNVITLLRTEKKIPTVMFF